MLVILNSVQLRQSVTLSTNWTSLLECNRVGVIYQCWCFTMSV